MQENREDGGGAVEGLEAEVGQRGPWVSGIKKLTSSNSQWQVYLLQMVLNDSLVSACCLLCFTYLYSTFTYIKLKLI